ncbi:class I SAM-dependent methyltransferase [bacterium]|nr:class I SAM-dependent methyltransferase [bacterium]
MLRSFKCNICGKDSWKVLGKRIYSVEDIPRLTDYQKKRYRVMFEVWFPGYRQVELTSLLCSNCGFVNYTPRPEDKDIESKYRFLRDIGGEQISISYNSALEQKRSRLLFEYIWKRIDLASVKDILDYGGADGRLMHPFVQAGKKCFNVDYNPETVPGVHRLGDTVEELDPVSYFDLIVASHVMEHVAEPSKIIMKLGEHLREGGALFIEVPMEIWKKPPLHNEPVTHINFFTPNSIENLLRLHDLSVIECGLSACFHPSGKWLPGVRAIGVKNQSAIEYPKIHLKKPDAYTYLKPGLTREIRYFFFKKWGIKRLL